ncbi:MAG: MoxR family ATPase [Thermoleophilaceae bacterium]
MQSPEEVARALADQGYLADRALATAVHLARALEQPLLLEGEAGVGKTEVARALAQATDAKLFRLQCHEGIDLHHALYDWDYPRQLLAIRAAEGGVDPGGCSLTTTCCAVPCSRRWSTTGRRCC